MPDGTCNVALVGTKFMGRAHSNAYLNAAKFFDLPVAPVMHTVAARNEDETKAFAQRWGWQNATTDWQSAVANEEVDLVESEARIGENTFFQGNLERPGWQQLCFERGWKPGDMQANLLVSWVIGMAV